MSRPGKFISLEGGEGVGKSTQLKALAVSLRQRGLEVIETREPGGSEGAERLRELLLTGSDERWSPRSEALLFAAARTDHVDKLIRPALEQGKWVVCDRFVDSSLAYQGAACALGIDAVRAINSFGIGEWFPDRTLVLTLEDGFERARARDSNSSDRIGARPGEYHDKVVSAFVAIAEQEPRRVKMIDASGSAPEVTARLLHALDDLLP